MISEKRRVKDNEMNQTRKKSWMEWYHYAKIKKEIIYFDITVVEFQSLLLLSCQKLATFRNAPLSLLKYLPEMKVFKAGKLIRE